MQEQLATYVRSLKNTKVWRLSAVAALPECFFICLSFVLHVAHYVDAIIIIIEFLTSQLWLGNIHLSWDLVINRIRLGGLIRSLKSFLHYYYYYYYYVLIFWGRCFEKSAILECLQIMTALSVFSLVN